MTSNNFSGNNNFAGSVGIGMVNPGAKLTVNGDGSNYGNGIRVTRGGNYWEMVHDGSEGITFGYNGVDKFVLNRLGATYFPTGNFGIGTTNTTSKLQVGNPGDGTRAWANSWNVYSSEKNKINITNVTFPDLEIQPVSYIQKNDPSRTVYYGFISESLPVGGKCF